jgi:hypothetical protein
MADSEVVDKLCWSRWINPSKNRGVIPYWLVRCPVTVEVRAPLGLEEVQGEEA